MEEILKDKDTIYFIVFLASIGGSALLIKHNVTVLMEDKVNMQNQIDELEKLIIKMEDKNKLSDEDLYKIFPTRDELNSKIVCVKDKIDNLHELIKELYEKDKR